jgi:hypothetical protein
MGTTLTIVVPNQHGWSVGINDLKSRICFNQLCVEWFCIFNNIIIRNWDWKRNFSTISSSWIELKNLVWVGEISGRICCAIFSENSEIEKIICRENNLTVIF